MRVFLQVCAFLFLPLLFPRAAHAAAERTDRQREILAELDSFRPPEASALSGGSGVWMLSVWDADAGLDGIIVPPSGNADNAARHFQSLEEAYPSEKASLAGGGEDSAGVRALLDAAEAGECAFSPEFYPEVTAADVRQPDFQVLREYLAALLRRGDRAAAAGDGAEAERCFRAALVCGRHLTAAKPSSVVFVTGLIFKVRGAQAFAGYLVRVGDAARAALVREYSARLAVLMRAFLWKANTALSEFDGFACLPAVVRVAREDAEAFWRKEAVLRLATLRYGVPDGAGESVARAPEFERLADETLEWVSANDADWTVRRMAVWAGMNVAPENYAGMRHGF